MIVHLTVVEGKMDGKNT